MKRMCFMLIFVAVTMSIGNESVADGVSLGGAVDSARRATSQPAPPPDPPIPPRVRPSRVDVVDWNEVSQPNVPRTRPGPVLISAGPWTGERVRTNNTLTFDLYEPSTAVVPASDPIWADRGLPGDGRYGPRCNPTSLPTRRFCFKDVNPDEPPCPYRNPFVVNDMMVAPGYEGVQVDRVSLAWTWQLPQDIPAATCYVTIFTAEDFDDTCAGFFPSDCNDPPFNGVYRGIRFKIDNLPSNDALHYYYLDEDLVDRPNDGPSSEFYLQMPYDGNGAYIILIQVDECDVPQRTGACCIDTACVVTTASDCAAQGGHYIGDFVACDPITCSEGACCIRIGDVVTCVDTTPEDCAVRGGSYQGNGSNCNARCPGSVTEDRTKSSKGAAGCELVLAPCAQPMLWGTKEPSTKYPWSGTNPSHQGPIQWDDDAIWDIDGDGLCDAVCRDLDGRTGCDNIPDTLHCPGAGGAGECYDYRLAFDQCPSPLGAMFAVYIADCNQNRVPDWKDIQLGISSDCNLNGIPDECDVNPSDPDRDGYVSLDCNSPPNGIPDECEVDCNGNGVPDDCDIVNGAPDCNQNGVPDSCDIASGISVDCNGNHLPDECESHPGCDQFSQPCDDCQMANEPGYGTPDACDIASGTSPDCNGNGVPDECDIASGASIDCNGNGVPDTCDIASGTIPDCNSNGIPDSCDIAGGASRDLNPEDGIPDECPAIFWSTIDSGGSIGSNSVEGWELRATIGQWDANSGGAADPYTVVGGFWVELMLRGDPNCDGRVNNFDIDAFVLALSDPTLFNMVYPDCDLRAADTNGDGLVNNFDIDFFVMCLVNNGCP